jgi:hypothetical protein
MAELSPFARRLDAAALADRGYRRCRHCDELTPLMVSRCRRRTCPGYGATWARDTMRKIRENLRVYDGLVCMCTLTAPGQDAGLVWDPEQCTHGPDERCSGRLGCKVAPGAAVVWNEHSRAWWRELNRIAKQHADRAVRRLGQDYKGGLLMYEWELQKRGVWHLHFVLGMGTPIEQVWVFAYVRAMRELAGSKGFGYVDARPLKAPQPARQVAAYLSKYLAKWSEDGSFEVTETVKTAGRTLVNYVSRRLTGASGITMRVLRDVRIAWAWREGHLPSSVLEPFRLLLALCVLEQGSVALRGP